jgi:hypothetical protein
MNYYYFLFIILILFVYFIFHVMSLIHTTYEFALLGFGTIPLFNSNLGNGLYKGEIDIPYNLKMKYKYLWIKRWIRDDWAYDLNRERELYYETLEYLKKNYELKNRVHQIDIVSPDIDKDEFINKYVKTPKPVVIRGLMKDSYAIKNWTREYLSEKYGDSKVIVSDLKKSTGDLWWRQEKYKYAPQWETSFKEAINPKTNGYIPGNSSLFEDNPKLSDDLTDYKNKLKEFLPSSSICSHKEAFIGNKKHKKDEGVVFHCSNEFNLFIMAQGRKKWQFINPEYSYLCGFMFHPHKLHNTANITGHNNTWRDKDELYKYIPIYETILEEGDVLLNPPWWWHAITNLTDFQVGIPTRWNISKFDYNITNSFFDLMQTTSYTKHLLKKNFIEKAIKNLEIKDVLHKDFLSATDDIKNLVQNHNYFHNIQYRYDDFDTRISNYK